MRLELPAVIAALDVVAFKAARAQRHSAMRTNIAQRKRASGRIAPDHQWLAKQMHGEKSALRHALRQRRGIPESAKHFGSDGLIGRWRLELGHYSPQCGLFVARINDSR